MSEVVQVASTMWNCGVKLRRKRLMRKEGPDTMVYDDCADVSCVCAKECATCGRSALTQNLLDTLSQLGSTAASLCAIAWLGNKIWGGAVCGQLLQPCQALCLRYRKGCQERDVLVLLTAPLTVCAGCIYKSAGCRPMLTILKLNGGVRT